MAEYVERELLYCDFEKCNGNNPKWTPGRVKTLIARQPAADVSTIQHGKWECEHESYGKLQCSNCKKEALLEKSAGDIGTILLYVTSNYCPNCGARMNDG